MVATPPQSQRKLEISACEFDPTTNPELLVPAGKTLQLLTIRSERELTVTALLAEDAKREFVSVTLLPKRLSAADVETNPVLEKVTRVGLLVMVDWPAATVMREKKALLGPEIENAADEPTEIPRSCTRTIAEEVPVPLPMVLSNICIAAATAFALPVGDGIRGVVEVMIEEGDWIAKTEVASGAVHVPSIVS